MLVCHLICKKMKNFYLTVVFLTSICANAQIYKQTKFEETLHGLTTIINILKGKPGAYNYSTYGTGFFYHKYSDHPKVSFNANINSIDSNLKSIWLITNKHVVFGKQNSERLNPPFPPAIDFYLRKKIKNSNYPRWDTIRIESSDLRLLTKMHKDSLTDVVAIDVTKFVLNRLSKGDSLYYYGAVSEINFPIPGLTVNLNGIAVEAGHEVLSVGYPKNFYDKLNLFPTIKSGVIASKWKTNYNGNPYFLIDAKLFPGSSGSIVITKPGSFGGKEGDFEFFQFLGVYSGNPFLDQKPIEFEDMTIIRRETYNIGIVWYYDLIEEIIK